VFRLFPLLLVLAACKGTDVPPRGSADSAVLGVRVNVTTYMSRQLTLQPDRVYFAKLPAGETSLLKATQIYVSNYRRGALLMLLNAEPGRYALVCAVTVWEGKDHFVYISEKTATESIIEVKAGEYVFMGSLSVKETRSFSKADAVQKRFLSLVRAGPANPNVWQKLFPRALEFLGEYGSITRGDSDVERTQKTMRKSLARHGW